MVIEFVCILIMKIKVSNLGVIKEAEIELKPLTVFIGRSGTGKTWTAHTLASIFSGYGFKEYLKAYSDKKNPIQYEILEQGIQEFLEVGNCQINLVEFAEQYAEKYINDAGRIAPNWLSHFLNTNRVNFNKLQISFLLNEFIKDLLNKIRKLSLDRKINFGSQLSLQILKQEDEDEIYFYRISEGNKDNFKLPVVLIRDLFSETILGIIHQCFYAYVYIFPTERTTYAGFPFSVQKRVLKSLEEEIDTEKSQPDKQKTQKITLGKSAVIQSLTSIIAGASVKTDDERQEEAEKNPQILEYINLANFLQEKILSGHVKVDSSTLQNEIIFQPSRDVNLEMQVASSMVKELAPLYLCLRYLVEPNELLIIDEPEMNLHPAAQVEIIEFLAMLVNAGIKILITTHSPYIVDHLSNLIKAAEYEDKESIKERFYLERTDAFIAQENVSVYLFEDGTAKDILQENGRIDWGTFADISDDINHIFP
ncbi:MAG: hypothetical protein EAZ87_24665 [Nostocales cyanobacterium]|nr:MAG: hypothetical protein EAZ87_24665 [Nostocales cyanobacterium]